jgi:ACS family hexuronate transporter-like MFS transporter
MTSQATASPAPAGRFRWIIVGLLFFAVMVNYIDRQMLGVLKPILDKDIGWTEQQYADTVFWFQAAYGISFLVSGRLIDKIGVRWGYAISYFLWQLAHMAHALVSTIGGFGFARGALGATEAANFPAAIKAVSEWFPQRERAFAIGIFNAGSNIGPIVTPLLVPFILEAFGWRMSFVIIGGVSLLWLWPWLTFYHAPSANKHVGAAELAYIESDPPEKETPIAWRRLLMRRETWAVALTKCLTDPIWWLFLFWLPDFLAKTYHLNLKTFGPPLVVIYLMANFGSMFGGWMSSKMLQRGRSVNFSRKATMLFLAIFALPVMFAQSVSNLWVAVLILGVATAAHQGFSANTYSLATDLFPKRVVGSVMGIGGFVGSIGGVLMAKYAGYVLQTFGSYTPLFVVAGCSYFSAVAVIHLLSPRLSRVEEP